MDQKIIQEEEDKEEENQDANLVYQLKDTAKDSKTGKLFLGGRQAASDVGFLTQNNIKAVLTMAESAYINYDENLQISHMLIAALDTTAYNIHNDFEPSFNFIDDNISKTNVLVHCEKGISRSPTVVIAYIMRKEMKIYSDILEQVRVKRQQIKPNGAFYFFLGKYSEELINRFKEEFQNNYEKKPQPHPGRILTLRKSEITEFLLKENEENKNEEKENEEK